ncbi:MAG: ATP-binding cassette domain-containing protein, partial [Acutalibacteraceae bacterium]
MSILKVRKLNKTYPGFSLSDVSFSLEEGKITGFIGRNGAGKSTTLGCILNLVSASSGEITVFGKSFSDDESAIKQKIGYVSGAVNFYPKKKLRTIASVTKEFYGEWDDEAYWKYMNLFSLDENKTPSALSAGMKVKFSLALALSHKAKLL